MTPHEPTIAVVVLNYNGLEDTLRCLDSLQDVKAPAHRVIVVDNASSVDPEEDVRRRFPAVAYLRNTENLGYAGGNNRGIRWALSEGAEYILVLNNDTVVAPAILQRLVDALSSDRHLGIVGPVVNFLDSPADVMTDGVEFNPGPGTEFFRRVVVPVGMTPTALVPVDIVNGCCMMLSADMIRRIGMFDESFFIVHEESDLCLRAQRAGYGCAVFGETLVWHKGSSAFIRSGRQLQRYLDARNLLLLLRRHAGKVGRSLPSSTWHYLKYVYFRYAVECEANQPEAADAVALGTYHGLIRVTGPKRNHSSAGAGVARACFAVLHGVKTIGRRA